MAKSTTPDYIKNLLMPNTQKQAGRKVWSVDLETVWLPFFLATNTTGDTSIPVDALGCPIRLGYDKDGSVKFSPTGRPVTKVAKPIADSVNLIRQNFIANLQNFSAKVADDKTAEYTLQVEAARVAGEPIRIHDQQQLDIAIQLQLAEAIREAEALVCDETTPDGDKIPETEKQLVTA